MSIFYSTCNNYYVSLVLIEMKYVGLDGHCVLKMLWDPCNKCIRVWINLIIYVLFINVILL